MQPCEVLIYDAVRTPHGSFMGALKLLPVTELGSCVIRTLLERHVSLSEAVDGIFMGEVLTAGEGQNPARHAAIQGGVPKRVPAETFNKVCASSLVALRHAANMLWLNQSRCMIVGGMESMSGSPRLISRCPSKMGNVIAYDSMLHDGLSEPSVPGRPHMGVLADQCAHQYNISRERQEDFAHASFVRAYRVAHEDFGGQVIPMIGKNGKILLQCDEGIRRPNREEMRALKPVFSPQNGSITARTSSQISDGASALLVASGFAINSFGWNPIARIRDFAVFSGLPKQYPTAPIGAINLLLKQTGYALADIDLFEINEAFAVVSLLAMQQLHIPHEKVNIWGGAIAIGHPLGASGTRIVGSLALQLRALGKKRGIAVACNGGGEAVAVLIERV